MSSSAGAAIDPLPAGGGGVTPGVGGGNCKSCFGNPYFLNLERHYLLQPNHRPIQRKINKKPNHFPLLVVENHIENIDSGNYMDDDNDNEPNNDNNPIDEEPDIDEILDQYFHLEVPVNQDILHQHSEGLPSQPLFYYKGPIPSELHRYHFNNPNIRQSKSVLEGLCNPSNGEYSQFYVDLQQTLMKEVFFIDNIQEALGSGRIEDFIEAVKEGHKNKTTNQKEDMWTELHYLFDRMEISDDDKRKLLIFMVKYGLEVPSDHNTLRNKFISHTMKALPSPILERVYYPPNWNIPNNFEPIYHLRYGILSSIVLHVTNPFVTLLSDKCDIHYLPYIATDSNGEQYVNHPMNAKYARRMYMRASKLPGFNKTTNLVWGLTLYCDGMNTDKFSNRKFLPVYGLLDCLGPTLITNI